MEIEDTDTTVPQPADYAPYHEREAFQRGYDAYSRGECIGPYSPDSADGQAYDRGLEYAMRLSRHHRER